jgi:uncharacterized membrane protein YccF (DUF307 family)
VRLVGNVIWFVFAGLWLAIGYAIAAFFCFILIITIPFGVASLRIAMLTIWPFGRVVVPEANKGAGSAIGNIIWFVIAGWWLTLVHIFTVTSVKLDVRRTRLYSKKVWRYDHLTLTAAWPS